jgi:predicted transcriptional regulator
MVKRESFSIAGIEDLSKPELEILKALAKWDFQLERPTIFNLAKKINYSISSVNIALQYLKARGLIVKSVGGVIHLPEPVKERILKELETS